MLYDAVALLPGAEGVAALAKKASAKDFVTDAFAHQKFIGYVAAANPLLEAAGVSGQLDEGFVDLAGTDAESFVQTLAALRYWDRDATP